jgi:hypothetical protein
MFQISATNMSTQIRAAWTKFRDYEAALADSGFRSLCGCDGCIYATQQENWLTEESDTLPSATCPLLWMRKRGSSEKH